MSYLATDPQRREQPTCGASSPMLPSGHRPFPSTTQGTQFCSLANKPTILILLIIGEQIFPK